MAASASRPSGDGGEDGSSGGAKDAVESKGGGDDARLVMVGRIRRAHGIHGEVAVELTTDRPERTFAEGRSLRMGDAGSGGVGAVEVRVERARPHKGGLIVVLEGVTTRSAAEALAGRDLLLPMAELEPLAEGEVFRHDLIGLEVRLPDGARVGQVRSVFEALPAELLEVDADGRLVLVPYTKEIVRELDLEARRLVIDPPEGLLDL